MLKRNNYGDEQFDISGDNGITYSVLSCWDVFKGIDHTCGRVKFVLTDKRYKNLSNKRIALALESNCKEKVIMLQAFVVECLPTSGMLAYCVIFLRFSNTI